MHRALAAAGVIQPCSHCIGGWLGATFCRPLTTGAGLIHAEALTFALAQTMPRPEAQTLVATLCQTALTTGTPLATLVAEHFPTLPRPPPPPPRPPPPPPPSRYRFPPSPPARLTDPLIAIVLECATAFRSEDKNYSDLFADCSRPHRRSGCSQDEQLRRGGRQCGRNAARRPFLALALRARPSAR